MGKKILILTSSPRKISNTKKMAESFAKGAKSAGHEIFYFDAAKNHIKGCNACNNCWKNGKACAVDDEFNKLAELLESCEVILISTPLYWIGFPAQVKAAIDKLYAYGGSGGLRPLAIKESYLFVCGELAGDNEEYQPIIKSYEISADFLGWKNRGMIITGGHDGKIKIEETNILQQAEQLGREL